MKFGSLLRTTADCLPEITCLFDTYKQLKKQLKRLPSKSEVSAAEGNELQQQALTQDEAQFVATIDRSLANLNNMFMEKEEEAVIRLEALQAASHVAVGDDTKRALYKQLVDFHGEVLLLVHWSVLAYTATVKILKKHHKRTGLLLRAPQLENLLSQPFCSTELMTQLAHKAEETVTELASSLSGSATSDATALAPRGDHDHTGGAAVAAKPQPTVTSIWSAEHTILPQRVHQNQQQLQGSVSATTTTTTETGMISGLDGRDRHGSTPSVHTSAKQLLALGSDRLALPGSSPQGPVSPATSVGVGPRPTVAMDGAVLPRGSVTNSGISGGTTADGSLSNDSEEDLSGDEASLQALNGLVAMQKMWQENRKRLRKDHGVAGEDSGRTSSGQVPVPGRTSSDAHEGSVEPGSMAASGVGSGLPPVPTRRSDLRPMDLLRRTQVALDTWSQLRATASTPSTVLPASVTTIAPSVGRVSNNTTQQTTPGQQQGNSRSHLTTCSGAAAALSAGVHSAGKRSREEYEQAGTKSDEVDQRLEPVTVASGVGDA